MANLSYHEPPKEDTLDDDDEATLDGASEPDPDDGGAPSEPATTPDPPEHAGIKAAKAFGMGLACIVGIPVVAALATAGGVVYGAGKILEGVGSGLAAGPRAVYNAADAAGQAPQETTKPKPKPKPKRKPNSKGSKPKSQ